MKSRGSLVPTKNTCSFLGIENVSKRTAKTATLPAHPLDSYKRLLSELNLAGVDALMSLIRVLYSESEANSFDSTNRNEDTSSSSTFKDRLNQIDMK